MAFNFNSPGVKFNVLDRSFTNGNQVLGLTSLGVVGEAPKGPAFENILITSDSEFATRFGGQSVEKIGNNLKYPATFVANTYLQEADQLYFTRVLGKTGYDAGNGWAITSIGSTNDSTTAITNTQVATGQTEPSGYWELAETDISSLDIGGSFTDEFNVSYDNENDVYIIDPTYQRISDYLQGIRYTFTIIEDTDTSSGTVREVAYTADTITGETKLNTDKVVLSTIRSRKIYVNDTLTPLVSAVTFYSGFTEGNPYRDFTIRTEGDLGGIEDYDVSMNPNASNFLPKVIGSSAKDKNTNIYVDEVYPELIKKLVSDGDVTGIESGFTKLTTNTFSDYNTSWKTPETPWIVSQLKGNKVDRLFKLVSISDGNSANREIKISFTNINPRDNTFNLLIRDFNDTDASPVVLESFSNLSLNMTSNNFIGQRIGGKTEGTDYMEYEVVSNYVYVELKDDIETGDFPAGFEGYNLRNYSSQNTGTQSATTPNIIYKTSYDSNERNSRIYLGVSERAYDTSVKGKGINPDFFEYKGNVNAASSYTKTNGFHMDSGATSNFNDGSDNIGKFSTGNGELRDETSILSGTYYASSEKRKFTVVPAGGFDGWDVYREERLIRDIDSPGGTRYFENNDYEAYLEAVRTFDNTEDPYINLFAVPGVNFSDHNSLVGEALDMIQNERKDAFYIMDGPELQVTDTMAQDYVNILDNAGFDTYYAATYFPYLIKKDNVSNKSITIPATGEVARVMALTDKVAFPWFAPAGVNRAQIDNARVKKKLRESDRDILYQGRVNPIAYFNDIGLDIFGQKNLQVDESLLDRINVVRMILHAKKIIQDIGKTLLFEQNDDTLIDQFLNQVNPVLRNIQNERGLRKFTVVPDDERNTPEARDQNKLFFILKLVPTSALEELGVTFEINPTGTDFSV